jgi:hypothetical protein
MAVADDLVEVVRIAWRDRPVENWRRRPASRINRDPMWHPLLDGRDRLNAATAGLCARAGLGVVEPSVEWTA